MNIKHISLLSLLCVASTQAETAPEKKFDIATKEYRNCRKSWPHFFGQTTCDEESKAFEQAKEEFLNLEREHLQKNTTECLEYCNKFGHTFYWGWPNIQKKYCEMYFKMDGHKVIIEAFDDENGDTFLNSNKSTDEFAGHALNNYKFRVRNELSEHQLSYMDKAHSEIMEMIKQQQ